MHQAQRSTAVQGFHLVLLGEARGAVDVNVSTIPSMSVCCLVPCGVSGRVAEQLVGPLATIADDLGCPTASWASCSGVAVASGVEVSVRVTPVGLPHVSVGSTHVNSSPNGSSHEVCGPANAVSGRVPSVAAPLP